jgi:propionaldehyde dehydrogenase
MQVTQSELNKIIEEVVAKVSQTLQPKTAETAGSSKSSFSSAKVNSKPGNGIFETLDDAVEAARKAQIELMTVTVEKRKAILEGMRIAARHHAHALAKLAVEETGMGRSEDKEKKILLAADKTPGMEDLISVARTGDRGLTLEEMAPFGVIGSITPSTNPAATFINNAVSMISAGNSVVFNPHPKAKLVSLKTMEILNQGIQDSGGPKNLLTSVGEPTLETSQSLMKHPGVRILAVTGGMGVVRQAMQSGKKTVCAGPGNPPVVVDETADIPKAAKNIVWGSSFDNNIMCQLEKECFVVNTAADQLISEMQKQGAYLLTNEQRDRLCSLILNCPGGGGCSEPGLNRDFIGKNASVLAKAIGLDLPDTVRLLICETEPSHPLIMTEQLMPFFPIARVKDVWEGIDWAVKAEHGYGHTAVMHSKNVERLSQMAYRINTAIFVKNGMASAGLGFGGEGHTTMTIGTTTGEGITSARHFTRFRRCTLVDYFRII